jgi:hypothetical protein
MYLCLMFNIYMFDNGERCKTCYYHIGKVEISWRTKRSCNCKLNEKKES